MDFRKQDRSADPGFFATEAAGLRWLADADGARVVEVLAADDHSITLQRLDSVAADRAGAEEFGRSLARTHAAGADTWGAPPPGTDGRGWIGPLPQRNQPESTWGQFYAEHRVRPFADQAHAAGSLDRSGYEVIGRVCERLIAGAFDDVDTPARIHGDLWSGNVIPTAAGWTLIDPAAHGGHPVTDLAMLELFGNPYLDRTFSAYAEAAALPDGWRDTIGLHQLHPLLVHAVLFGGGYAARAVAAARAYA
ncbi:fructosamine kinase family protein [Enemella evansiae]|uniref:fructosamine kinase family protein n=1 Tax=Enemella evansiae TaxID=2016499 RepID=UPI001061C2DA|nr:fructosamine kinase family protein [Enemella evansiae]TDO89917.1 fructosamine-3-kinase [Enemella evansiae]